MFASNSLPFLIVGVTLALGGCKGDPSPSVHGPEPRGDAAIEVSTTSWKTFDTEDDPFVFQYPPQLALRMDAGNSALRIGEDFILLEPVDLSSVFGPPTQGPVPAACGAPLDLSAFSEAFRACYGQRVEAGHGGQLLLVSVQCEDGYRLRYTACGAGKPYVLDYLVPIPLPDRWNDLEARRRDIAAIFAGDVGDVTINGKISTLRAIAKTFAIKF